MLVWHEDNKGVWLGFDDALIYRVKQDSPSWHFEYVLDMDDMNGIGSYTTADEAMDAAEADYEAREAEIDWDDEPILSPEELDEILGDRLAHERLENEKLGLGW